MHSFFKKLLNGTSLYNFTCLGKTVSTNLMFNGFYFLFFLKKDTLPQMHRISREIIIDTFKSVEFIAIYGCFDKPTL